MTRSDRRIDRPRLAERLPSDSCTTAPTAVGCGMCSAGAHHGAYCLGCCWSLMALFVVVGRRTWPPWWCWPRSCWPRSWVHGELLARLVGVAALALAVAVIWVPALAPGLHSTSQMMNMAGS